MIECLTIANQKGGVGKSTTAGALGAALSLKGYRVLYVDLDAQGNLSYSMNATSRPLSSLEVLTGTATIEEAITKAETGDILPASPALAGADALVTETGKEYRLKEALETVSDKYDYCIIDTPPALGVLTVNALTACNGVIIPAQADVFSIQGIGLLHQSIQAIKKYCNHGLSIKGILITRFNGRTIISQDMAQLLEDTADRMQTRVLKARIRECAALKEAQASQKDIFIYAPKSNAAADYKAALNEIIEE